MARRAIGTCLWRTSCQKDGLSPGLGFSHSSSTMLRSATWRVARLASLRTHTPTRLLRTATVWQSSSKDRATGVDPGYTATQDTTQQQPPQPARPSTSTDPFPLPFDPRLQGLSLASEHQSHGLSEGDVDQPIPLRVPGREPGKESREVKIARLIYQTRKRGTLETDILLSTFAKDELRTLSDEEVDEFDRVSTAFNTMCSAHESLAS